MDKLFIVLALILAAAAAYFLWRGNGETAFILVALAVVSYFLNMRMQIKGRLRKYEAEELDRQDAEENARRAELTAPSEPGSWIDSNTESPHTSESKVQNLDD